MPDALSFLIVSATAIGWAKGCPAPMQREPTENAGFSCGSPWLSPTPDHGERNVEALAQEPKSILMLYRRLIDLRRSHLALSVGDYRPLPMADDVLAFERSRGQERFIVMLNLGQHATKVGVPDATASCNLVLSTHLDRENETVTGGIELRPDEGVILSCS